MKSTLIGVALLIVSVGATAWTAYTITREPNDRRTTTVTATTTIGPPTPTPGLARPDYASLDLSAQSIYLIDLNSGRVLFEREPDAPHAPASTAKLITALTAIRYVRPEEVVIIEDTDVVDPVQESSMGLQAGDTVTVHDLFVGLFLPSGNDAANALARFAGERIPDTSQPPVERFVAEMNVTASKIGMSNSHFVNPSGDDVDGQFVTAHDLMLASEALLADPALRPIVAIPATEVRVGGSNARVIRLATTNDLLLTSGVYGVKTGTTEQAGQCLIVAYRTQQENVIAVLLGSQDRYGDARALLGLPPPPVEPTPSAAP